ncbi:hypothetical protein NX801_27665 [Streptomyces sp. LP05-1]|uniref:SseB protein N-terminal domain-containing protein n=1 Tax=Streptomyces pyxinae TaxID=2970734 RepID=A0ABT2CPH9_9ACTN|nr:hypothetical protein [Streptomyces sp. LP05-1]MCS0639348.1 hypothetical protein [Streptomyces sp. LP05-1]
MSDNGGRAGEPPRTVPRSRLADLADHAGVTERPPAADPAAAAGPAPEPEPAAEPAANPEPAAAAAPGDAAPTTVPASDAGVAARRRAFAELLGEFRRTAVLVPLGDGPGPDGERGERGEQSTRGEPGLLTADFNGIRFILAFSDEQALARYARARGEQAREWTYRTVLGARLLDVAVPAAGVPCGVALDCADGPDGMVFPPVRGIVPDAAAVDIDDEGDVA